MKTIKLILTTFFSILIFNIMAQDAIIIKLKDTNQKLVIDNRISKIERISNTKIIKLVVNSDVDKNELSSELRNNDRIDWVEFDVLGHTHGSSEIIPSDAQYYKQWALQNNGDIPFTKSIKNSDIEMERAWDIEQGDSNVIVAIIDSGLKTDQPDFNGRLWSNYSEIPNNGLDDDNNGFIDDFNGWNFTDGTNNIDDDSGHGTNITSIIGANGNNSVAFTGMDWNCKLMILKVTKNDLGYYSWWVNSIYYAVDNGANVINMSLGGDTESKALNEAIQYALDHNVVVVVSMGNLNSDKISYPSNYPGVIAVGATNPDDSRCKSFSWNAKNGSNYGSHISVVAPGNYIFGLSNKSISEYDTYFSGTSQAAAYVSGLASLLIAQTPSISNVELKEIIEKTADDLIGDPKEDIIGKDNFYGNGRINAFKALAVNHDDAFELSEEDFLVYPNPSTGFINLRFPIETESIQVFNSMGVMVFEKHINQQTGQTFSIYEKGVFSIKINARSQMISKKAILI